MASPIPGLPGISGSIRMSERWTHSHRHVPPSFLEREHRTSLRFTKTRGSAHGSALTNSAVSSAVVTSSRLSGHLTVAPQSGPTFGSTGLKLAATSSRLSGYLTVTLHNRAPHSGQLAFWHLLHLSNPQLPGSELLLESLLLVPWDTIW